MYGKEVFYGTIITIGQLPWEGKDENRQIDYQEQVAEELGVELLEPRQNLFDQPPFEEFVSDAVDEIGRVIDELIETRNQERLPLFLQEGGDWRGQSMVAICWLLHHSAKALYPTPWEIYSKDSDSPFLSLAELQHAGKSTMDIHIPTREELLNLFENKYWDRGVSTTASVRLGKDLSELFWKFYFEHGFSNEILWYLYIGEEARGGRAPIYNGPGAVNYNYRNKDPDQYKHLCAPVYLTWRTDFCIQISQTILEWHRRNLRGEPLEQGVKSDQLLGIEEMLPDGRAVIDPETLRLLRSEVISGGRSLSARNWREIKIMKKDE